MRTLREAVCEMLCACMAGSMLVSVATAGPAAADTPAPAAAARAPDSVESDAELAARVRAALNSASYFYAEHTNVVIENGAVILSGEVEDNRAMYDGIEIAQRVAPGRKIINHFSISKVSPR